MTHRESVAGPRSLTSALVIKEKKNQRYSAAVILSKRMPENQAI